MQFKNCTGNKKATLSHSQIFWLPKAPQRQHSPVLFKIKTFFFVFCLGSPEASIHCLYVQGHRGEVHPGQVTIVSQGNTEAHRTSNHTCKPAACASNQVSLTLH
ncbi:hypothetical protein CHARACLAT_007345 [Characodon lateralis]|uniref:Uncharacterized protein n=1 Tax=Characodon lateralis TaxID=208331 RepID=A0ABU7CNE1_9TELE|nr:hypothetical protein [Characodon lateralis]